MVKVVAGPNHNSKGESLRYGRAHMAINPLTKCDRQHRMAFSAVTLTHDESRRIAANIAKLPEPWRLNTHPRAKNSLKNIRLRTGWGRIEQCVIAWPDTVLAVLGGRDCFLASDQGGASVDSG